MTTIKLTGISDTHGQHRDVELPGGDILLHCGDIAYHRGDVRELDDFLWWFEAQPYKHKVFIAGNHDFMFEKHPELISNRLQGKDLVYLQDSSISLCGLNIYGSPWQPWFHNWAFNLPRDGEDIRQKWLQIPADTNILLTHGPPYGIGDMTSGMEMAGCKQLFERLHSLKRLKAHLCGHIHEGYGVRYPFDGDHLAVINCSVLDANYRLVNKPINFEVNL